MSRCRNTSWIGWNAPENATRGMSAQYGSTVTSISRSRTLTPLPSPRTISSTPHTEPSTPLPSYIQVGNEVVVRVDGKQRRGTILSIDRTDDEPRIEVQLLDARGKPAGAATGTIDSLEIM